MTINKILHYLSPKTNIPVKNEEYNYSSAAIELKKHNAVLLKNAESRLMSERDYYSTLTAILDQVDIEHVQYIFRIFELIRNQCAQTKQNQEMFVESGIWKPAIKIIEIVSDSPTIRMGIQMLTNLMTDNTTTQSLLWKHIVESKVLVIGLSSGDAKTLKSTLIGIYNCTHNDRQASNLLFQGRLANEILNLILNASNDFVQDEQDIVFELSIAILTGFLESDQLPIKWDSIQDIHLRICLLKVLDGIFHSESDLRNLNLTQTGIFLISILKKSLQEVENVPDFEQIDENINSALMVAFYILQYWCIVSEKVPQDSDLLHESLSYVLTVLERISPKVDLKQNQSMRLSKKDVREISVFCIRNLLQDNKENQDLIDGMEAVGIEDNLQEFGVEARLENGKIKIRQNK
ncbi:hypothetical protein HDV06_002314 [Boothiomyces sp. JEL0866]|nr:hypothetical protein HDV06_002314 [Boothiomyces sp. JEL0866]